jgi:hypothetical protein
MALRGILMLMLTDVGNVGAGAATSDNGGGVSVAWTYGADVPCRIDPMGPTSGIVGGRIDERTTHIVTVPAGTVISAGNRFAITGRGTFEVTATHQQTGGSRAMSPDALTFEVLEL